MSRCPTCGIDLEALGPPMGMDHVPDLGGYCADCVPCPECGKASHTCHCLAPEIPPEILALN